MNRKEVISFRKVIPANTTDVLQERIKDPGTVEEVRIRFYSGVQKSLQVNPFIEHKGHKMENLITYPNTTDQFLSGEDDYLIYPVVVEVDYDDYLKISAKNTDLSNPYTLAVDVVIDYYGGKKRVVGGLISG